jgi:uncharacterized membrane protein
MDRCKKMNKSYTISNIIAIFLVLMFFVRMDAQQVKKEGEEVVYEKKDEDLSRQKITDEALAKLKKNVSDSESVISDSEDLIRKSWERIKKAKEKLEKQTKEGTIANEEFELKRKKIEKAEKQLSILEESMKTGKAKLETAKKQN